MCADAPPPAYAGPGDAHSQQEWVWRREDYAALFADGAGGRAAAGEHSLLSVPRRGPVGGSPRSCPTPGCWWWSGTRSTGRTPTGCTCGWTGWSRSATSWPPGTPRTSGWPRGGRRSGTTDGSAATASSWPTCSTRVDRERVLVLRYWQLVVPAGRDAEPGRALPRHRGGPDRHRAAGQLAPVRPTRAARRRCSAGRSATGAAAGRLFPPQVWRQASRPLVAALQQGGLKQRPRLAPEQREAPGRGVPGRHRPAGGGARRVLRRLALGHRPRLLRRASSDLAERRLRRPTSSGRGSRRGGRPRSRSGCGRRAAARR